MSQSADQAHPTYDVDDAVNRLRADYDMTPYTSNSYPQSAPGQLAAIGYLFGLDTPEVATARVLEIGCGAGGNLIPFAAAHPRAVSWESICRRCRSTTGARVCTP